MNFFNDANVNYQGSEFIGDNNAAKFGVSFVQQIKALLGGEEEQAVFYAGEKLSVFESTASTQDKGTHHFNSPNVSSENCSNTFMDLTNTEKYAISPSTDFEEANPETKLYIQSNQSPADSTDANMSTEGKEKGGAKTESGQSIYKNKYKESFEQAKAIFDEVLKLNNAKLLEVLNQASKDCQGWEKEGEDLRPKLREFEEKERRLDAVKTELESVQNDLKRDKSIKNDISKVQKAIKELRSKAPKSEKESKKAKKQLDKAMNEENSLLAENAELKKRIPDAKTKENALKKEQKELVKTLEGPKTRLLEALKVKRLARFAPICELLKEIKTHVTKEQSMEYFDSYKAKRSMKYFESYMADEELFYWILLIKIVLLLIPQEKAFLQLLPLKKENVSFMFWMMDSPIMKLKHKNLFKESYVRGHLRAEFTRVCNTLVAAAKKKFEKGEWSNEKWTLMQKILRAGEEIPDLYANTNSTAMNSPMAQDFIFGTEDNQHYDVEELIGKRLFDDMMSYNHISIDSDDEGSEPEKRFYHGYCWNEMRESL